MTPVYLNPASSSFPFVDLKEEQHLQLFLSPHQAATSLSGPTNFFNTTHDQRESKLAESRQHDDHEVDKYSISLGRSSDHKLFPSSSFQPVVNDDDDDDSNFHKLFSSKTEDGTEGSGDSSVNWMPSRTTTMQEMTNSNRSETDHQPMKFMLKFHNQQCQNNVNDINSSSNSNIRVCSDCNTTSTPLWRSGPRGPKSLCNACGIRQRKARRAMAAAENGAVISVEASSSTKSKVNSKVKKLRTSHVVQGKKLSNKPPNPPLQSQKKLCFKNLALSLSKNPVLRQVLPHDVEEAAILLMELSCGFIHS